MSDTREIDHLTNLVGAFVTSVEDDLRAALEREVGAGGALPAALLTLDTWPDRSIDFLCGVVNLTHSGAVRLVARMESDGLVVRGVGRDARTAALRLSRRGEHRAGRAREARRRVLDAVVDPLSGRERQVLRDALGRVLRAGTRTRTEAQHACRLCDHTVCRDPECPIGASVDAD